MCKKFGKRFGYAVVPAFLLLFMYTLFTPLDIIISNESYFSYSWVDVIAPLVVGCLGGTIVLSCVLALFPKDAFEMQSEKRKTTSGSFLC